MLDPIKNNSALTKSIGNVEQNDENYYAQRVNQFAEWFLESHGKLSKLEVRKLFSMADMYYVYMRHQITAINWADHSIIDTYSWKNFAGSKQPELMDKSK